MQSRRRPDRKAPPDSPFMPSRSIARRPGNVNAGPAFPRPYCLTERGRDDDVVPGGEIVAGDGRNSPVTQRSGTQPAGENGRMGDRPAGAINGMSAAGTGTLSGSSDGHSNSANGASVEPGEIGYRGRHTAS